MTGILLKRGNVEMDSGQGERHVNIKAEIGVTHLQAKKHQRLPANHQREGPGTGTSSEPSEEPTLLIP